MKQISALLIFMFFCNVNIGFSQIKTPYEKKVDQIMTEMCKAIGVENSLIQMAVKLNDWDIVRTSQDLAFKSKMLDKNELLVIILATEQKLKDAEKLKNNLDHQKQREKEEKEKQAKEQQLQKELTRFSDLYEIKNQIVTEFSKWVEKGEFETISDYQVRTNNKHKIIDSIAFGIVSNRIAMLHGDYEHYNNPTHYYLELKNYDADKQFYPVLLVRRISYNGTYQNKNVTINDTLLVNIELAKLIKQNSEKNRFYTNSDADIIWFRSQNIIYSKNLDNWIVNSNGFFFPKSYNLFQKYNHTTKSTQTPINGIKIHTNDLGLSKYFPADYVIDIEKYSTKKIEEERKIVLIKADRFLAENKLEQAKKMYLEANELRFTEDINVKIHDVESKIIELKRNELIRSAEQHEKDGNLSNSIEKLEKANELFKEANSLRASEDIRLKIVDIENKLIEIKQNEIIKTAEQCQKSGRISNSIEKFEEANRLKPKAELATRINDLKRLRTEALANHSQLDSLYSLAGSEKIKLFNDIVVLDDLDEIKKGFGGNYLACKTLLTTNTNSDWASILNSFNEINKTRNREVWDEKSNQLLARIIELRTELNRNSNFEPRIQKALLAKDKKFLKILKDDDSNKIIEFVLTNE